jgi:hypothetical protein
VKSQWGHRRAWEVSEKYLKELTDKPPSGCRWCGIRERNHWWLWIEPVGSHGWVPPTNEQIKQRMWERRQDRETIRRNK